MIHYPHDLTDPTKPIREVNKILSVRYRTFDDNYKEEEEDCIFSYDKDEIAESATPLLSLSEIRRKCMIEFKLKDEDEDQ